ncbi:hypothetical protein [Mycobacterium pseudoshottsii]|uniref:hypothetical protein n=1 Tax=Mycobacterium pseudoshottsii TaxID=265949 RepID=UPI003B8328B3
MTDALSAAGRRRLILIYAPSGYGKSTLAAQWREELVRAGVAVAWLTIDDGDNNPVWFLAHLLESIRRVHPGGGRVTGPRTRGARRRREPLPTDVDHRRPARRRRADHPDRRRLAARVRQPNHRRPEFSARTRVPSPADHRHQLVPDGTAVEQTATGR